MRSGFIVRDRRWLWSFLAVLAIVLGTDYLSLHWLFPKRPRDSGAPNSITTTATPAADTFADTLKSCFVSEAPLAGPTSLLERMESRGLQARHTDVEEWHINRPSGREERVSLAASTREPTNGQMEVRLLEANESGQWIAKALDDAKALNPSREYLTSLVGPGDVFFHERRENLRFADGSVANAEWVNDRLHTLEVRRADKTFTCHERDCECR